MFVSKRDINVSFTKQYNATSSLFHFELTLPVFQEGCTPRRECSGKRWIWAGLNARREAEIEGPLSTRPKSTVAQEGDSRREG